MGIFKISPVAAHDLINIYVRGVQQWGPDKAERYQHELMSAFQLLADNPEMGRPVTIRPALQRHEVSPYVIFYRKFSYGVRIARLLYKNRVMEKHL